MRSKISYFNPTLFKKNLTRFWPLWGGASALGALAPLWVLIALLEEGFRSHAGKGLEITSIYYIALSYGVPIVSLCYGCLCALAVWHYLYNARSVGFCHSLPITRKGLFITNFLSGMAMMLIPYAVTGGLLVLITIPAGLFDPVGVLVTILGVLGETFFYFAAATFIVFITGNPFAFAAFYFIFHFLAVGAEYLAQWLVSLFYFGVSFSYKGVAAFLSPTVYFIDHLQNITKHNEILTPEGWTERMELVSVTLGGAWCIAVYALVGAVLLGCAWALYRRRRSESAGEVVAVGWMKPVFRYGVALCAALAGGVVLYLIFVADFTHSETARLLPMFVCMGIAGLVGYYIASMLLAKSLKVFRHSGKGAALTVIASIAVCCLIASDPFGVDSWIPDAGELMYVDVHLNAPGGYLEIRLRDPADMEKVMDLHRTVLAEKALLDDTSTELWTNSSTWLNISYRGTGESDYVHRYYRLPFSEAAMAQLESVQKVAALATDPSIQGANIFEQFYNNNVTNARPTGGYVGGVYDTGTDERDGADLTPEQTETLEAAIRRDIQARHFGRTMFMLDSEERERSVYSGYLELYYNVTDDNIYNNSNNVQQRVYLEISIYCTETLKALEDIGVLDETHKILTSVEEGERSRRIRDGLTYDWGEPGSYSEAVY